jgi:alkylated DNA repair dioxygenase AlkB
MPNNTVETTKLNLQRITTGSIDLEDYPILEDLDRLDHRIKQDNNCNKNFYNHIATWYGDVDYVYSGVRHQAQPLPPEFQGIAQDLEEGLGFENGYFNSLLVNSYTNKGLGAHSDDEEIFRKKDRTIGAVATISLGGSADITISRNYSSESYTFTTDHGDLYVMPDGNFQLGWKHAVSKCTEPRISLTFRHIP